MFCITFLNDCMCLETHHMKLDLVVFLSVLRKFWVLEPLGLRILSLYYHHYGSAEDPGTNVLRNLPSVHSSNPASWHSWSGSDIYSCAYMSLHPSVVKRKTDARPVQQFKRIKGENQPGGCSHSHCSLCFLSK